MSRKILVADDQPGIRMLLKELFMDEGYDVATAETGADTLDYIYKGPYDLLILDYKLPVVDGKDVLKQLSKDRMGMQAIVMSGLTGDIERDVKQLPIVHGFFPKPFNLQELSLCVKDVLTDYSWAE